MRTIPQKTSESQQSNFNSFEEALQALAVNLDLWLHNRIYAKVD